MFNQFIDLLLALCFLAAGGYCIHTFITTGAWDGLKPNAILYPTDCSPALCIDPQDFLRFIRLRLLLLGSLCVITAVIVLLTYLPIALPWYTQILGFLLGVLSWVFYVLSLKVARKRYW